MLKARTMLKARPSVRVFARRRAYAVCAHTSVMMLAGSTGISPKNTGEWVLSFVASLAGLFLFAMVQGTVCAMLSTGNPMEQKYKADLDMLNFLMREQHMAQTDCHVPQLVN